MKRKRFTYLHLLEWTCEKDISNIVNSLFLFEPDFCIANGDFSTGRCQKCEMKFTKIIPQSVISDCSVSCGQYFHPGCLPEPLKCSMCLEEFTDEFAQDLEKWLKCDCCVFGHDYFHKACLADYLDCIV